MVNAKHTLKQPTIKTIAREAGVSISTVSNVLNRNTDQMSEDTLLRVQKAIQQLKYRPNQIARGLVTRRTATVGLILAEIETPLFLQALNTIERDARSAGYSLVLLHARGVEEEQQALELLLEKQVEGVMFLSTSEIKDDWHLRDLQASQLPVVLINRSARHDHFDQVNWDNVSGAVAALDHLVTLGHGRIAYLMGPIRRLGVQERFQGYKLGLEKHGLAYREDYVQNGDYTLPPEVWRDSTLALLALPERPTAIIASDDMVAAVACQTIREAGLNIPRDISVVGIDDQPFLSFLALTTIKLPIVEAGKHGIEMLIERIADPYRDFRQIMLPCALIERKSSGPAPE
jgi:DNA-binding LacI/PurR family transcriptional regulator